MRIGDSDIISRQTVTSARSVLIACFALLVVHYFELNTGGWTILTRTIDTKEFSFIASLGMLMLMIGHLVNWMSDYFFFKNWFNRNSFEKGDMDSISDLQKFQPPIKILAQNVVWLKQAVEKLPQANEEDEERRRVALATHANQLDKRIRAIEDHWGNVAYLLNQLDKRFGRVTNMARLILVGWYLFVPISLSIWALWVTVFL